jgi:hypothetical protein
MRGLDPRIHFLVVVRRPVWIAGSSPRLSGTILAVGSDAILTSVLSVKYQSKIVMAGLDPAIHLAPLGAVAAMACPRAGLRPDPWDARVKPGHDGFCCTVTPLGMLRLQVLPQANDVPDNRRSSPANDVKGQSRKHTTSYSSMRP